MLSQSPVFARTLAEKFPSNAERVINLPEDSVEEFGKVLMYLYSKQFPVKNAKDLEGTSSELGRMYFAAQKYELDGLKTLTLEKIENAIDPVDHPENFLTIAQTISSAIPASDVILHEFLTRTFCDLLGVGKPYTKAMYLDPAVRAKFHSIIRQDGQLAVDAFEAQCSINACKADQARYAADQAKRDIEKQAARAEEWQSTAERWEEHHETCEGGYQCDMDPSRI